MNKLKLSLIIFILIMNIIIFVLVCSLSGAVDNLKSNLPQSSCGAEVGSNTISCNN